MKCRNLTLVHGTITQLLQYLTDDMEVDILQFLTKNGDRLHNGKIINGQEISFWGESMYIGT